MTLKAALNHLEFSELVKLAAETTTKTADEFLHYRAQSLIGAISTETKKPANRTTADEAEEDAMDHLTGAKSPKGIRIRPSARARAQSILDAYQNEMDSIYIRSMRSLSGARLLLSLKRMKKSKFEKEMEKYNKRMRESQVLRNKLMLRLTRTGNLRKDEVGRYYLTNRTGNLQSKQRLNVSAIAARNEIKQRRRSGGALHASFAILYKELLKYKLGEATRGDVSFPNGSTWKYAFKFDKEKKEFNLSLGNAAFRSNKPVRIVKDGMRAEEAQMRTYLAKKLSEGFNKK